MNLFLQKQGDFWAKLLNPVIKEETRALSGNNRFSFQELKNLYEVLEKNPVVTEANKALVVETIRNVAEFLIWGDQNEPRVFEFFMENNVLAYLHRILLLPANRSGDIAKQVLQTLSIIIQNISSETGTYFLFSSNHVNRIITVPFDFNDEEVLGYFVSFLKAISLKLTRQTSQFLINIGEDGKLLFPLYTEAIKFAHHKEGMVRAGCRTMTLSIFSVGDPHIDVFVSTPPATRYLSDLSAYLARNIKILDQHMLSAEGFGPRQLAELDSQLAEVEDVLSYCSDVLSSGHPYLTHILALQLWSSVVGPLLLAPLLLRQQPPAVDGSVAKGSGAVQPACALFVLERIFLLLEYSPLVNNLALALFGHTAGSRCGLALAGSSGRCDGPTGGAPSCPGLCRISPLIMRDLEPEEAMGSVTEVNESGQPHHPLEHVGKEGDEEDPFDGIWHGSCREAIAAMLRAGGSGGGRQALVAGGALRMIVATARCAAAAPELLHALGLLPHAKLSLLVESSCRPGEVGQSPCPVCSLADAMHCKGAADGQPQQELMNQPVPGSGSGARGAVACAGRLSFEYCMVWTTCSKPEVPVVEPAEADEESAAGRGPAEPAHKAVSALSGPLAASAGTTNERQLSELLPSSSSVSSQARGDSQDRMAGDQQLRQEEGSPSAAGAQSLPKATLGAAPTQDEHRDEVEEQKEAEGEEEQAREEQEEEEEEEPPMMTPDWSVRLHYDGQQSITAPDTLPLQQEPPQGVPLIDFDEEVPGYTAEHPALLVETTAGVSDLLSPTPLQQPSQPTVLAPAPAAVQSLEDTGALHEADSLIDLDDLIPAPAANPGSACEAPGHPALTANCSVEAPGASSLLIDYEEMVGSTSELTWLPLVPEPAAPASELTCPPLAPEPEAPASELTCLPLTPEPAAPASGLPFAPLAPEPAAAASGLTWPSPAPKPVTSVPGPTWLIPEPEPEPPATELESAATSSRGEEDEHGGLALPSSPGAAPQGPSEDNASQDAALDDDEARSPSTAQAFGEAAALPPAPPPAPLLPPPAPDPPEIESDILGDLQAEDRAASGSPGPAETAGAPSAPAKQNIVTTLELTVGSEDDMQGGSSGMQEASALEPPKGLSMAVNVPGVSHYESDDSGVTSSSTPRLTLQQSISPRSTVDLYGMLPEGAAGRGGAPNSGPPLQGPPSSRQLQLERGEGEPLQATRQASCSPPPSAAPAAAAAPCCHPLEFVGSEDLSDAMFSLMSSPLLPVSGLWNISYLVSQVSSARRDDSGPSSAHAPASSSASTGGSGSRVDALLISEGQRSQLQVALDEAVSRVLEELGGSMWCDAVFPLLCMEWPLAAEAAARPLLRASADVLMAGPALYPPRVTAADEEDGMAGGAAGSAGVGRAQAAAAVAKMMGLSGSAASALHVYHAVQRLVAALQLGQLVRVGAVDKLPPVPAHQDWEQRGLDLSEGSQVELLPSMAIPCIVSFSPGQERRVYYSVAGAALSRLQAHHAAGSPGGQMPDASALLADERTAISLLHSSASVVLADPAPTRLNAGIVASLAPLMGSIPVVDKNVTKWLHVHVRPSVRGLLRVLRTVPKKKGGVLAAMRQLADGHWVLAFPDADRAAAASLMARRHTDWLRSCYTELLVSLISSC